MRRGRGRSVRGVATAQVGALAVGRAGWGLGARCVLESAEEDTSTPNRVPAPSRRPAAPSLACRRPCPGSSDADTTREEKMRGKIRRGFRDTENNHQY